MRVAALAFLLVAPLLAGCFGSGDAPSGQLAKPTDVAVMPPVPPTPQRQQQLFNASDPGYRVPTPWHVGDGWDYESNSSTPQYRAVRVVGESVVDGRHYWRVDESYGRVGTRAFGRAHLWVDSETYRVVNSTDTSGSTIWFEPPKPLRFYRNATYWYNQTGTDLLTGNLIHAQWFFYSFAEARWEVFRLADGRQVPVFKVIHEGFSGNTTTAITYWVNPDWGNPLRYRVDDVQWTLVAADEGGRRYGVLQPT